MSSGLKQRIVTGVILIIAVLFGVLSLSPSWFAVITLIVFVSLGGWEWGRLVDFDDFSRGVFVAGLLAVAFIAYWWVDDSRWVVITAGVLGWVVALVLLSRYKQGTEFYKQNKWILRLAGFFVLLPAWVALITLHATNPLLVLYLIFLVAIADSGAYFTGKAFGKNKLAPELSPGKTREGALGGLAGAFVWSILGAWFFNVTGTDWISFIVLSVASGMLSVSGDLFESLIKREAGMKDSGNILPGHGGILDRVDGLIAVLPLFTLGVFLTAIKIS
ncbi:MAG TPA: phosphatidate cytidylyltransferase [Leucothrix mucor]|nr:phosphatidate cytidylyltransferase [Leucothrix mucor]